MFYGNWNLLLSTKRQRRTRKRGERKIKRRKGSKAPSEKKMTRRCWRNKPLSDVVERRRPDFKGLVKKELQDFN